MTISNKTRVLALAAASAVALSACGGGGAGSVPGDCSVEDYNSWGEAERSECMVTSIDITIWEDADRMLVVTDQALHGESYLRALGEIPDRHESVSEAVAAAQEELEAWSDPEWELEQDVWSLTTDERWTVGDFISASDLDNSISTSGHNLNITFTEVSRLSSYGLNWDGEALVLDTEAPYGINNGQLSITFPGSVESTNGSTSGNTVTWEFSDDETARFEAVYRP